MDFELVLCSDPIRRCCVLMPWSIEAELLLATARRDMTTEARDHLHAGLRGGADWNAVIQAALEHGTAALLCSHLLALGHDLLPSEMRLAAARFLNGNREAGDAAVADLFRILDVLAAAGVGAVAFKGPALTCQAYGDLALRGFRDLDFLIRAEDIQSTMALLAGLGYRSQAEGLNARRMLAYYRYNGQDILFAEDRLPVEPHWAFAPRTLSARLDTTGVLQRATPLSLAGRVVQTLSPEDTLIVAGLHGFKERWNRLLLIADVAEFLRRHPGLDWDAVLRRAGEAGLLRMVMLGLALAEQLLGAPVPDQIRRIAAADRVCQSLTKQVAARLFDGARTQRSVYEVSAFGWRARERISDRFRYIAATLTTARVQHFRLVDLPEPVGFAYPAVKMAHDYLALPLWLTGKSLRSAWNRRGPK